MRWVNRIVLQLQAFRDSGPHWRGGRLFLPRHYGKVKPPELQPYGLLTTVCSGVGVCDKRRRGPNHKRTFRRKDGDAR